MKKLGLLLLLSIFGFMGYAQQKPDATLITNANTVINAGPGENTASRIGNDFLDLANSKRSVIPLTASGTNTYIAASSVITSYSSGIFDILFQNGNSGASTLNINSLGAINLQKLVSGSYTALVSGDIQNNQLLKVWYDQPNNTFQIFLGGGGTSGGGGTTTNALSIAAELISGGASSFNGSAAKSIGIQPTSVTNAMLAGSIDLTAKVTGLLPDGNIASSATWNAKQSAITFGTGVQTALGVNIGSAGSIIVNGGALGTPASGNGTNITNIPAANILSGALVNGMTATTQSASDNSTKLATTAYVDAAAGGGGSSTPTANTVSKWDASVNFSANNLVPSYTTTAAASGTTTLTVTSTALQYFTGTANQTIVLPVTSTLPRTGLSYIIDNTGNTGTLTVNSSGANLVVTMAAGSKATITCILTSGTTAASWNVLYLAANPLTTVGDLLVGGTVVNGVATPSRLAGGASGTFVGGNGVGIAPTYLVPTSDMILATNTNSSATAGNIGETITGTPVTSYTNLTTTATYKQISTITLTAGDWTIRASFTLFGNAATITAASDAIFVVSTTTASATGAVEGKSIFYIPQNDFVTSSSAHQSGTITFRVSLSGSQAYFLNGQGTFTVGNMQYVGALEATRNR